MKELYAGNELSQVGSRDLHGSFYELGLPVVGVLLFGVYSRAPDFWRFPHLNTENPPVPSIQKSAPQLQRSPGCRRLEFEFPPLLRRLAFVVLRHLCTDDGMSSLLLEKVGGLNTGLGPLGILVSLLCFVFAINTAGGTI